MPATFARCHPNCGHIHGTVTTHSSLFRLNRHETFITVTLSTRVMVVPTLITETYRMVNPGAPLPVPSLRGAVGLHCPVCATPMIYKRANKESWLIGAMPNSFK
ncbi:uncharacterized protein MELLADRAFT_87888 [Melampsora larici-populina 98AG31]|uniref:Uncharacterized protein n=1 Tax=Melampsora larici-populina (strain 98AG31 / pathotype 3-4-7) TaxID=747676 RepID=F4RPW4_MELLP|nr:uncharacterized protein MELLADRAFT_87888 [Melampsora larici-populina 98AG31]EGG05618.1 hypothetical protein MELLADRAFT_87888 [Melampsora larici-populina 98AG31]